MSIDRELLESYLDNALSTAQMAELERALRSDAAAAALLKKLRQERALRMAALKSFEPTPEEARQLASQWLEEFQNTPAGRIHTRRWIWQMTKVAAVFLIAAASFYAGQASKSSEAPAAQQWQVVVQQSDGETSTREFTNLDEAQNYAAQMTGSTARVDEGGVL